MINRKTKLIIAAIAALVVEAVVPAFVSTVQAAPPPQFDQAFVRLDRHKELTATGGTICATPSSATSTATETLIVVTFPTQTVGTDFVVNSTASNWTVTTTNLPTGATAWPGIGTATNVTGHTVTFPSGDLSAATQYCFNFSDTNTLTNGSAGASSGIVNATLISYDNQGTPAPVNQTNWATALITDDQIVVSAVVPPNFTITLDGNTDAFPANLDPATISVTGGRTVSITTNAKSGWIAWVKDSQQGLYSATANYKINTSGSVDGAPTTLAANAEGYVLDVNLVTDATGGCAVTIDPEYNGGANQGGTLSANFQPIASCTGTPPAASDGDTIQLQELATIKGSTVAGSDYSDILTVVGAGNF